MPENVIVMARTPVDGKLWDFPNLGITLRIQTRLPVLVHHGSRLEQRIHDCLSRRLQNIPLILEFWTESIYIPNSLFDCLRDTQLCFPPRDCRYRWKTLKNRGIVAPILKKRHVSLNARIKEIALGWIWEGAKFKWLNTPVVPQNLPWHFSSRNHSFRRFLIFQTVPKKQAIWKRDKICRTKLHCK